jgi:hypothetical protein
MKNRKGKASRVWAAIKYIAGCFVADVTVRVVTKLACSLGALFVALHLLPPPKDRTLALLVPPGDGFVGNGVIRVAVTPGLTDTSAIWITAGTSAFRIDGGPKGPTGSVIGPPSF